VSARFLLGFFDSVYVIALTAWVGSILFFSFVVAPVIFTVLGPEAGGKLVRALFPRYHAWGAIAGAIALPAYVAVPLCYPEYRGPVVGIQAMILLGCVLVMLYAGNSLTPAINDARDAGAEGEARFRQLHRRSVRLNAVILVGGIGLLIAFANRPAPRTTGIPELGPVEKARFDAELDQVILDVERKYGFRPGAPGQGAGAGPTLKAIDPEAVQEIESYYREKRRRDLALEGKDPGAGPVAPAPPSPADAPSSGPRSEPSGIR
jgi:hypothetical protein